MGIEFTCPRCGTRTNVNEKYVGQSGHCVSCGAPIIAGKPHVEKPKLSQIPRGSGATTGVMLGLVLGSVSVAICVLCVIPIGLFVQTGAISLLPTPAPPTAQICQDHFKQIGLAMLNYETTYQTFPPAFTVDENGNRLHSWRVLLLPFLDQGGLYQHIRLDEPWDSPHNQQFHEPVLAVYQCPRVAAVVADLTETNVMVVVGPNTAFRDDGIPVKSTEITDGPTNTVLVVEVIHSGVHWMQPDDLDVVTVSTTVNDLFPAIGSGHTHGPHLVLCDGTVTSLPSNTPPLIAMGMLTRNGGEPGFHP